MKQSELNHLRRLLAWVHCEIGQSPDELIRTLQGMAHAIDSVDDGGKRRLVETYDKAARVPRYVRAAVKALQQMVGSAGSVVDAEPHSPRSALIGVTSKSEKPL